MIAFFAALIEDRRLALWAAGGVAVIAGSVAPWLHVASPLRPLTERGLDADGKLTLLCGVVALGLLGAYVRLRARDLAVGGLLCAGASAVLSVLYVVRVRQGSARVLARMLDVEPSIVKPDFGASAGLGVWVVAVGSLLIVMTTAGLVVRSSSPAAGPAGDS